MIIDFNLSSFIRQSVAMPTINAFCVVRLFAYLVAECCELRVKVTVDTCRN